MQYCSEYLSRKIKVLSFIAMVCVVSIHADPSPLIVGMGPATRIFSDIVRGLRLWAVPFFFMVSGFFFARRMKAHEGRVLYKDFYISKVKSLVIPYICWGGIFGLLVAVPLRIFVNLTKGDPMLSGTPLAAKNILNIIDCIFGVFHGSPANGALWFVRMLIIIFTLAPLLKYIQRSKVVLLLVGFTLFVAINGENVVMDTISIGSLSLYFKWSALGCFILGMFVSESKLDVHKCGCWAAGVSMLLLFIALFAWLKGLNWAGTSISIAMILFVWSLYDIIPPFLSLKLPWIMNLSFFIYCMHHPIVGYVGAGIRAIIGKGVWQYYVMLIVMPIIIIGIAALIARILYCKSRPVFLLLSGGR